MSKAGMSNGIWPDYITEIHSNGRVQVPVEIRRMWGVQDRDNVYWFIDGDDVILRAKPESKPWRKAKFAP